MEGRERPKWLLTALANEGGMPDHLAKQLTDVVFDAMRRELLERGELRVVSTFRIQAYLDGGFAFQPGVGKVPRMRVRVRLSPRFRADLRQRVLELDRPA